MKKHLILFSSIFLFSFLNISAQTAPIAVKQISGGVLNGKAVTLVKPPYPAAARAVYAQGAVNVKVTIDEEGNVIAAEAVSGHPLLQQASVQAAQQSKFKPTMLNGQAVKVTGIIVYNFVAPDRPINWLEVGLDLSTVQNVQSIIFLDLTSIEKAFSPDWISEREQLKRLGEIKQAEVLKVNSPAVPDEKPTVNSTEKQSDGAETRKVLVGRILQSGNMPDPEQVAISQSLIASLQSRLGGDRLNLWRFNTGISLNQALSKLRFPNEPERLDSFRNQIQNAPAEISPELIADLQKILTILERQNPTAEDRREFALIKRIMSVEKTFFTNSSNAERILAGAGIFVGLAGAFAVGYFNPTTVKFFPACPFHALTGLNCPGCGLTRGFHALFQGDVLSALRFNAMLPVYFLFFLYLFVSLALVLIRGRGLEFRVFSPRLIYGFLVLTLVFAVARNLAFYPFNLLAI